MKNSADQLQRLINSQVGKGGVRNIVVALQSHDGSFNFTAAAGISDPQSGAAMTAETPYFIASVTKMYTAAVVMQLSAENRLDLEAPIGRYLPPALVQGIHVFKGVDYSARLTSAHLISQTSGLPDYETDRPRGGKSVMDDLKAGCDREISTAEALEIVRRLPPRFPPGMPGKAYYSNANFRLLGEIIATVSGKSMAENFQERIFAPLGLQHTYLFDWRTAHPDGAPATIYWKDSPAAVPRYLASNVPDGGLVSTAGECLAFLRAFFEGRLFPRELLGRMMQWNAIFFPLRYGWGLMYFRLPRYFSLAYLPEFIGHSGSTGSFAFTCPSRSLYIAGTVNQVASPAKPFFLMIDLLRAFK